MGAPCLEVLTRRGLHNAPTPTERRSETQQTRGVVTHTSSTQRHGTQQRASKVLIVKLMDVVELMDGRAQRPYMLTLLSKSNPEILARVWPLGDEYSSKCVSIINRSNPWTCFEPWPPLRKKIV